MPSIASCVFVMFAVAMIGSCASPAQQFEHRARALGLERLEITGTRFSHFIYRKPGINLRGSQPDVLLVYLDGDGTPGAGRGAEPSVDPTPREPLALSLMIKSSQPGIYLTRPCYNREHHESICDSALWTSARYSYDVVGSSTAALERYARDHGNPQIILVGYSGGGALAMLMAPHVSQLKGVITIAANLDTDAWTAAHGYLPLVGSLNPANLDESTVPALHFLGERDTNVSSAMLDGYFAKHPHAEIQHIQSFDHRCCWVEEWPTLLEKALRLIETHSLLQ
ncbi:MAG TPA: hypothetical protein VET48_06230 [Steroidobacteraceae bacterium]|nr:hypothetical protein [Steroidobacteraceae bacterium]